MDLELLPLILLKKLLIKFKYLLFLYKWKLKLLNILSKKDISILML
jgi:hypothetical protein